MIQKAPPDWLWLLVNLLIPVIGVLFLHWDLFSLLYLFWVELILSGLFGLLSILLAHNGKKYWLAALFPKIGSMLMYAVLFGALLVLIMTYSLKASDTETLMNPPGGSRTNTKLGWALIAMAINFSLEFISVYLLNGRYKRAFHIPELMSSLTRLMPLAFIILFVVAPYAARLDGHQANIFLVLGIILVKNLLDFFFEKGNGIVQMSSISNGGAERRHY